MVEEGEEMKKYREEQEETARWLRGIGKHRQGEREYGQKEIWNTYIIYKLLMCITLYIICAITSISWRRKDSASNQV